MYFSWGRTAPNGPCRIHAHRPPIIVDDPMTPAERKKNIWLSTAMGPITAFFGVVNGVCECGKPKTDKHKPGKHPRGGRGWQTKNATQDHDTLSEWCRAYPDANFAVVTGVASVVLDLDVRPEKDGVAELEQIETAAGHTLPPTITVLSGSGTGAKHLYFALPSNLKALQKPKGTKGIDFLRSSQAAIVPGSRHESGHYYKFAPGLSPADVTLADLPAWFLEVMEKRNATERSDGPVPNNIGELFDALLEAGPPRGARSPGRLRSDDIVERKMKKVSERMYPDDRSHSDSHWAWTLARNTCHHWDQYLRLWKKSPIRRLPGTKCGRASYEQNILEKAFVDQKQQWGNLTRPPVELSANVSLAKRIRVLTNHTETPRSAIAEAVVRQNFREPHLNDRGIADALNATGNFDRTITRDYVKQIRRRYAHLWRHPKS